MKAIGPAAAVASDVRPTAVTTVRMRGRGHRQAQLARHVLPHFQHREAARQGDQHRREEHEAGARDPDMAPIAGVQRPPPATAAPTITRSSAPLARSRGVQPGQHRADADPDQHQAVTAARPTPARKDQYGQRRQHPRCHCGGGGVEGPGRAEDQQGDGPPVAAPGGEADHIGRAERVARDRLERRPRHAKRRTDASRGQQARQTHVLQDAEWQPGPGRCPDRADRTCAGDNCIVPGAQQEQCQTERQHQRAQSDRQGARAPQQADAA